MLRSGREVKVATDRVSLALIREVGLSGEMTRTVGEDTDR